MAGSPTVIAAALGGHLVHVIVIGGALLLAAAVYVIGAVTAPDQTRGQADTPPARQATLTGRQTTPARDRAVRPASAVIAQQVAFLGLCAAAGTHLAVMPAHFQQSWMYGTFFAVVALLQVALGLVVLLRPHRAELSAALVFSAAVVLVWSVSRFVGVPIGPDNGGTEDLGVLDLFATACELLAAGALVYLLRGERRWIRDAAASAWRWSLWSPATRVLMAATVVTVPLLSALASRT